MSTPKTAPRTRRSSKKDGASQSKTLRRDRFQAWFVHHQITAVESLLRLLSTPLQSIMTWLVVAIALVLPAALYVGLDNAQQMGAGVENTGKMSVFIHRKARDSAIQGLSERLLSRPDVARISLISPSEALAEFQLRSGFGGIVERLDSNPLPSVLLVEPMLENTDTKTLAQLQKNILKEAIVEDVSIDLQWVERLNYILVLAQRLVMALALLLVLGVLLVVGNTIRLAIEGRRDEILVVKLVGGTNAFVRRPFLYAGLWYGLGGGVLAALILSAGLAWLAGPISHLADLYQSEFRLRGLDWNSSGSLILGAGLVGLSGAWLAVGRHLNQIEPK